MSIIAWTVPGLIAGCIASKLVNRTGAGLVPDIGSGIVGVVAGGVVLKPLGAAGVTALNFASLPVAVVGAGPALPISHALMGRRAVS